MDRPVRPQADADERLDAMHVARIVVGRATAGPTRKCRSRPRADAGRRSCADRPVEQHEVGARGPDVRHRRRRSPPARAGSRSADTPAARPAPRSRNWTTSQSPGGPVPQRRRVRAAQHVRLAAALQRCPTPRRTRTAARIQSPGVAGRQRIEKRAEHRRPPDLAVERVAVVVGRREDRDRPRPGTSARPPRAARSGSSSPVSSGRSRNSTSTGDWAATTGARTAARTSRPAPRRRPPRSGRRSPPRWPASSIRSMR